ncbi:protein translocase subunit SecF [Candidatus Shapirobacteria bacterium CG11_big_fil_rev_8_21_14_0_20_40_12]|uniref:Protein-export membrane protein SecF n=2 Tax=Candidatus Shapironibacteriota TaxID=1752721 RepID=A0A2M8EV49_9BACT|nr:MAG: protein translocase subunit SecF [Candidatus Shapirobacteria bacterium CG11_big_fil_rev_8_21_14_0_20_40_12]PJC28987.1 MAG: protein translocase subunit SecF [Candidatus Shapirobacteria bacterium CG_4_9_14_0_2_um_filter_40_11]
MKFMKHKWLFFLISALVIIPGLFSLIKWRLQPSIDFTGGTILELEFTQAVGDRLSAISETLNELKIDYSSIQTSGEKRILIKAKPITREDVSSIIGTLAEKVGEKPAELRFDTVGPTLGKELIKKTLVAILLGACFILLYVWKQFKQPMYGVCAVLAMFHDSLVLLGVFSLLGHFSGVEIDTLFVTAVLTILSFSVHDTVVVYDRIRESRKKFPGVTFVDLADKAVTETLPRSINNSMTIILMLLALYLLGGSTMKWFVFALLVGTVSGTYSSTFTAAPLLVVWEQFKRRKK